MRVVAILGMAFMLWGCAIGHKYDYSKVNADFETETEKAVSISVVDQRPYVVNGDKPPRFVGLQRAGFGIPYNVTTKSGQPLARQMSEAIVEALEKRDIQAQSLIVGPGTDLAQVIEEFQSGSAQRLLLVNVRQWKTDVYSQVTMHWNLIASVYDASGHRLAQNSISGVAPVGAASVFQDGNSELATAEMSKKLGKLLNDEGIQRSLN